MKPKLRQERGVWYCYLPPNAWGWSHIGVGATKEQAYATWRFP